MEKLEDLIKYNHVGKKYNNKVILKDVNFSIKKGEAVALIGDNGSGKSTILKMTAGLTSVSYGKIRLSGEVRFGYIPERFAKCNFTIPGLMRRLGAMEGIPREELDDRTRELYSKYHLEEMLDVPMKHLSKGTLQKAAVIQALLRKPDILLMDEPLDGQDIHSQDEFVRQMKELKRDGVTIIMSCHEKQLINQLADRILKIEKKHCIPIAMLD